MRFTALLGLAVLVSGCTRQEAPPAADTAAMTDAPGATSLASFAGMWDVNVMPEGSDSVATTHVLNVTDTAAWKLEFTDQTGADVRVTGMRGDTVLAEAGPFESGVRRGVQVRTTNSYWLQDGKIMGTTRARYETTGADTVRLFRSVGTKRN